MQDDACSIGVSPQQAVCQCDGVHWFPAVVVQPGSHAAAGSLQDKPDMNPCFNVLGFDTRDNTPIDRRAGYDNPVIAAAQRALPEAKAKADAAEEVRS
jgi:hypothetical protein